MAGTVTGERSIVAFFLITFAVTWPCFTAVAILSQQGPPGMAGGLLPGLLLFAGIFAPAFAAITLTAIESGPSGVAALLRPLFAWRVAPHWYLFAIGYMATVKLLVALIHRAMLGTWPEFGAGPWYLIVVGTLASTIVGGQAGEEVGWRGYALPRLATRFGAGGGSACARNRTLWAGHPHRGSHRP